MWGQLRLGARRPWLYHFPRAWSWRGRGRFMCSVLGYLPGHVSPPPRWPVRSQPASDPCQPLTCQPAHPMTQHFLRHLQSHTYLLLPFASLTTTWPCLPLLIKLTFSVYVLTVWATSELGVQEKTSLVTKEVDVHGRNLKSKNKVCKCILSHPSVSLKSHPSGATSLISYRFFQNLLFFSVLAHRFNKTEHSVLTLEDIPFGIHQ